MRGCCHSTEVLYQSWTLSTRTGRGTRGYTASLTPTRCSPTLTHDLAQPLRREEMPMQFGLFMMPLHPPERSFTESYDRDLAQIVLADRLGYHEVWIGEHLTERWENAPAPELLIAQALLKTEKIILATGVTLLAL